MPGVPAWRSRTSFGKRTVCCTRSSAGEQFVTARLPCASTWPPGQPRWSQVPGLMETIKPGGTSMVAPRKYPEELRERAIRMTLDARKDPASRPGACARIGDQFGINPETLRVWVTQAEVYAGDHQLHGAVQELLRSRADLHHADQRGCADRSEHLRRRPDRSAVGAGGARRGTGARDR